MIGIVIFYLVAMHLVVGMLISLLPISLRVLGVKFFRFNGTICLVILVLAQSVYHLYGSGLDVDSASKRVLYWKALIDSASPWLWACSGLVLAYILGLSYRNISLSRSLLIVAGLLGGGSLAFIASSLANRAIPPDQGLFIFPLDFLLSALVLGSVVICMILGHWYLVVPGMSVRHLQTMAVIFIAVVVLRILLASYTSVLVWRDLSASGAELLSNVILVNILFYAQRVLFGLVLPLALSWMIWQTVKIRSTQSATGILYVAVVFILFGEFLSRYILVSTGYPL